MLRTRVKEFDNGLRVVLCPKPALTVASHLLILFGERQVEPEMPEALHLLEHLVFKPEKKTFDTIKRCGGILNGATGPDGVSFYWWVPSRKVQLALSVYRHILLEAPNYWTHEIVEREKRVILNEVSEAYSKPEGMLSVHFRKKLLGPDAPGAHTPEEVRRAFERLSLGDLKELLSSLTPAVSCCALVGDVSDETANVLASYLDDWRGEKIKLRPIIPKPEVGVHRIQRSDVESTFIRIGWITVDYRHEDNIALRALASILAAFPTSRLYQELRIKRGLVYGVSAVQVSSFDHGYLEISTATRRGKEDEVLEIILRELEKLADEGPDVGELEETKEWLEGTTSLLADSWQSLASVLAENTLVHGNPTWFLDEMLPRLRRLRPEDIQRVARKYLRRERAVVCILGD